MEIVINIPPETLFVLGVLIAGLYRRLPRGAAPCGTSPPARLRRAPSGPQGASDSLVQVEGKY